MTEHLSQQIEGRILDFLADDDVRYGWLRRGVGDHGFLPLYVGWVATLGIRPDGTLVRWNHEDDPTHLHELDNAFQQRMAIKQAVDRYPELEALIPPRPDDAVVCEKCSGSGKAHAQVICECGGVGWVIPGEDHGEAPG